MIDYYPLIAAALAMLLAQLSKPFFLYFKTRKLDLYQILAAGGFPSSHTATMSALTTAFALRDGLSSPQFSIAAVLTGIIAYDAMNVRLYAGKHIAVTKQLINDLKDLHTIEMDSPIYLTKLKNILGHERIEVAAGFIFGIILTYILYLLI